MRKLAFSKLLLILVLVPLVALTMFAGTLTYQNWSHKGAGETDSASSQVLSSAQALSVEGNKLNVEMDKFLATVRAA